MRALLLIILLMSGCTGNKKQSANQSLIDNEISNSNDIFVLDSYSHKIITNYPLTSLSTNPIYLDGTNSNYILSYGLTPELYLLETLDNLERYGYYWEYIPFGSEDCALDGKISNNTYYIYGDTVWYMSMYYSPQDNKYYLVQDIEIVSNIHALFSNIYTNIQEPYYIDHDHSAPEKEITYIADISTNQRLYYKPDNKSYLVKTLHPIIDYEILYFTNSTTEAIKIPLSSNIVMYPFTNESNYLKYTNNTGIVFDRNIYENGLLSTKDTNFILELDGNED